MALVADRENPAGGEHEITAVGRLTRMPGSREGEIAVLVADRFQHCGLGSELLGRLIQVARDEKLERIHAIILLENMGMRALAAKYGFEVVKDADLSSIHAVLRSTPARRFPSAAEEGFSRSSVPSHRVCVRTAIPRRQRLKPD